MITNSKRLFGLVVCLLLSLGAAASAQTDTREPTPREVVLRAVDQLDAGYRFTFARESHSTLWTDKDESDKYSVLDNATGIHLPNGDYFIDVTQESASEMFPPELVNTVRYVQLADVLYVRLGEVDAAVWGYDEGWWRYDDLLEQAYDDYLVLRAEEMVKDLPTIASLPLEDHYIVSVAELPSEESDGIAMRVFDVELNLLLIRIRETLQSPWERLSAWILYNIAEDVQMDRFSLTYRLWTGAEDGNLYRGEGQETIVAVWREGGPIERMETESVITFTISGHGTVTAFPIPDDPIFGD